MSLYFEDFAIGDAHETPARVVTAADIEHLAAVSGDFNPLHFDREYARSYGYDAPVAHYYLGLFIAAGLIGQLDVLDRTGIAVLSLSWQFHAPISAGDTVRVRTTITKLKPTSKSDRGFLVREIVMLNQRDETVQTGTQELLVLRRPKT